jgi:Ion channel
VAYGSKSGANLTAMSVWWQRAKNTPSALLLSVQLAGLLLYPFMEGTSQGRAAFAVLGIVVLSLAVLAVRRTPSFTWISIALAVPAVALLVAQIFSAQPALVPWSSAFEAALYFYAAFGLIRYMFADHIVTTDELFAVGATFTLVAWGFAYVYVLIQYVAPASFIAALHPESPRSWIELLFLSFTTLTSTGLSDVVPVRPFARSVLMIEQLAGVLYIAMVITRLVGLSSGRYDTNAAQPPSEAGGERAPN